MIVGGFVVFGFVRGVRFFGGFGGCGGESEAVGKFVVEVGRGLDTFEFSVLTEGDAAIGFGDDDRDGIRLFGDADTSAMAGAEVFGDLGLDGEGKETSGAGDAAIMEDGGTIVERGVGEEEVEEEFFGGEGVEFGALLDVGGEFGFAFDDDESADFFGGEEFDRADDLRDTLIAEIGEDGLSVEGIESEFGEDAADVVLEEDHEDEDRRSEDLVEEPGDGAEFEGFGGEVEGDEEEDALDDLSGFGAFEEKEEAVDQVGDEKEIQQGEPEEGISEGEGELEVSPDLSHGRGGLLIAVKTWRSFRVEATS